jgi:hypothetical protein
MDNIIEPNESFDFSKLTLAIPSSIQGGAYFTKILYNDKPLYIQTTKSFTKQGIVKSGKKIHCDLMFDINSETLINWFEHLESKCQKLIYEKSDSWFQNALEMNDVESAFNSILRVYKSGKYYLVRTNIRTNTTTNIPLIKIYNESELPLTIDDIHSETNIISILEIQGIKFTSRNFQIEIELKQVMVLNNEPIFDSCLIKKKTFEKQINYETNKEVSSITDLEKAIVNEIKNENNTRPLDIVNNVNSANIVNNANAVNTINTINTVNNSLDKSQELIIEDLNDDIDDNTELKEIDMDVCLESNLETIKLKNPNEVYYELYKEARSKAKQLKKETIIAYLEAKNIKNTYMLDELDYSDNEFDNEIDDVSESELECL